MDDYSLAIASLWLLRVMGYGLDYLTCAGGGQKAHREFVSVANN